MSKARDFVRIRAAARERGDFTLAHAMQVELDRLGYRDDDPGAGVVETTAVAMPERAVPLQKRGRPPKPRCEHGKLVGRCLSCEEESDAV